MGNDKPKRDFNYVGDTVAGLLKVAESEKLFGQVVNIGSGREISTGDVSKKIITLTKSKAKILRDTKRLRPKNSEVMRLLADNAKVRKATGWKPEVSLEEGLEKTIEYIRAHPQNFKIGEYQI
jgi:dTDP-glucose 4,6-dehydratase